MTHGELEVETDTVRKVFMRRSSEKYAFDDAYDP